MQKFKLSIKLYYILPPDNSPPDISPLKYHTQKQMSNVKVVAAICQSDELFGGEKTNSHIY